MGWRLSYANPRVPRRAEPSQPVHSIAVNNAAPAMGAAHHSTCLGQRSEGALAAERMEIAPPRAVAVAGPRWAPSLVKSAVEPAKAAVVFGYSYGYKEFLFWGRSL